MFYLITLFLLQVSLLSTCLSKYHVSTVQHFIISCKIVLRYIFLIETIVRVYSAFVQGVVTPNVTA